MGYITAETSIFYYCHGNNAHCNDQATLTRSLYLAILYQFFRETSCDIRDIDEDIRDGMKTLPIRLGKTNTLLLMAIMGTLLDTLITKGIRLNWSGIQMNSSLFLGSILRVGTLIGVYTRILQYPRENYLAWGMISLLGLAPVLWAQACLVGSE